MALNSIAGHSLMRALAHAPTQFRTKPFLHRALSTTATEGPSASTEQETPQGPPKLIVFGARGFVGSHVCQEAAAMGLPVVGISRSGTPPAIRESWQDQVEWVRGNILEPQTYAKYLPGAIGAISCVGAFGTQQEMLRTNGTANITAIEQCKAAGIPRFAYISANIPSVPGLGYVLQGYIGGKHQAEEALKRIYGTAGVALRPGTIYGNRVLSANITLPLGLVLQPLEKVISCLPNAKQLAGMPLVGAAFVPPVSVESVAKAAVAAATDNNITSGIMDVWEIQQYK